MLSTTSKVEQSLLLGPILTSSIPLNASTQKCRSSFRNLIFLPLFWNWVPYKSQFAFQCSWIWSESQRCMTRSLLLSQINARRSMEDRERICLPITTNPCTLYNCTIGVLVFVFVFLNWEKICLPMMNNDMSSNYQHTIMYNCTIDLTERETSKYIPQLLRQQPPNVWHRVYCSNNVSHCFF